MNRLHIFVLMSVIALSSCAHKQPARDLALEREDWKSWCSLNSNDAKSGSVLAMNNVGACYADGLGGFPKDPDMAVQWFTLAARWGNFAAKQNLMNKGAPVPEPDLFVAKKMEKDLEAQLPQQRAASLSG